MAQLDWYIRANLKFSHLQLLVALDDLRSVGRVAAYLNVTQPAVSKALSGLEANLDLKLFDRTTRGMEPTEHGECLLRHARDILQRLGGVEEELLGISEGRIARISIGVLPSAAMVLVPNFIARLNDVTTGVSVTVREGTMGTLLPMLRAGDIDFVVGNLPERPLEPDFETEQLYEDPIMLVARSGHPLANTPNLKWSMLSGYPMVIPTKDASTRASIVDVLAQNKLEVPQQHVESLSTLTNMGVLQFTDSIAFATRLLARHFERLGVLSVLPLSVPNTALHVGLVWLSTRRMSKVHDVIRRMFRETRDALLPPPTARH